MRILDTETEVYIVVEARSYVVMELRYLESSRLVCFVCIQYSLFRFDASSHALSISSYLREQRQELGATVSVARSSHYMIFQGTNLT